MPMRWLKRYIAEHDRIMAAEALAMATRVAVGSGHARNASSLMRQWREQQGVRSATRVEASDRASVIAVAHVLGVPMRVVKVSARD